MPTHSKHRIHRKHRKNKFTQKTQKTQLLASVLPQSYAQSIRSPLGSEKWKMKKIFAMMLF